jgi:protoporphyrinogen oxidase
MKIGIIGAGFTGLAAAYYLSKKGHSITIFEKDTKPGGLAVGYGEKGWDWSLEAHYHHWFTNDKSVLDLAKEINHKVIIKRPKTSSFVDGNIYQLDSPLSLIKFPKLNILNRFRMGASLAFLRYNPFWKPLENFYAQPFLEKSMGKTSYKKLWEPLMVNKLGKYSSKVSLAWFWARIYKRTPNLAYPEGGFLEFAYNLEKRIKENGGKFYYNTEVKNLSSKKTPQIIYSVAEKQPKIETFEKVIVTIPLSLFLKITPTLPSWYIEKYRKLISIGAMNLILRLKKPFFKDGTYWLSMCDLKSPILAIVEHTNFMDKKNYNNEHLVYLGNYMETTDKRFSMKKEDLLKLYDPWLKKINPNYQLFILNSQLFHAPFAQPIITPKYSKQIPPFKTPLKEVYLANIQQVYPWDRGTNYAVELGKKAAEKIDE